MTSVEEIKKNFVQSERSYDYLKNEKSKRLFLQKFIMYIFYFEVEGILVETSLYLKKQNKCVFM